MGEEFKLKIQAMLDKVKSIANIRKDIKSITPKLPKIKIQGTLDNSKTKSELNTKLKTIRPKVKVDADTTQAVKKVKKLGQQKVKTTVQPTIDNSQVVSGLKEAQKQTKTLWDRFVSGAVGVNLVRMSVQKVTQSIYQAIAGIKELDRIKTDIQTASGVGDPKVNSMMQSYNQMAKDLSSTTKDVGNAANEIVRMGESLSNTNKLIENSTMLAKIGMIESSQATEYLISSMKGFQVSAENSGKIIDKLTSVDMEAAVSAGGLAEAMSRCANIANSSGTSMDRLIGYMATVGEVTQDSMSVIGNSFKSMYSRMNNIKIGRFIDDETGESLSDTEAVLNKLGIKLRDTENTYRDFDDVLDDVGNNWKDFTQVEQNAISVAIAGTMQRERFIALMNNYSNALKFSETAANSAGSALERYGVYQDSIEAKTNGLTAAIESLSMNVVTEELYSGIIQATTGLVEFLDKTNLLKGALSGLVAMSVSKAIVSIGTGFITAAKSTAQLTSAMALFKNGKSADNLRDIGAACKGLNNNQLKLILSMKGLRTEQRLAILEGMGLEEQERKQTLATLGFANAENVATASTFSLKNAWNALKIVIASNPIGAAITAITTAVTIGTMIFSGFNQALDDTRQKARELGESINSTKSEIEDYKTKIAELHTVINNSGSSISDVTEARKNLMSIQDELIEKFGTEKDVIDAITVAVNGQTDAFDKLTQIQWREMKNEFNDTDLANKMLNIFSGYKNNIDRMLDEYGNYEVKVDLSYASSNYKSKEAQEIRELLEANSMEVSFTMNGTGVPFVELSGTADEVHDKIVKIQELFSEDNPLSSDNFSNYLTGLANSAKDMSDQYKEMYDNYILYEKIFTNDSYADSFKNITEAYEEYRKANISGDEEAVSRASENYADIIASAMEGALANGDTGVAGYFESMYPELQSVIEKWEFRTKILPDFDISGLKGKTENEVLEMLQTEGMQNGEEVFNSLIEKATEYGIVTGDNSEKVQQLLDMLVDLKILQRKISEEQDETAQNIPPSFQEAFGSLGTDIQQKLLDLAKSGEITASTLESTDEYASLLTQTGLSAESAKNQILDMLSVQEKLSGAGNGLDKLKTSYGEFKELGFVTAQSLESLPDAFKELEGYDLFTEIAGDPTQGKEKIQQAFNDIVTEYITSQDTMSGLVDASEAQIQSYIANLKEMGIVNAEEVVNTAVKVLNEENKLINDAEKEYINYLDAKEGYDGEYLKSAVSKNSQLAEALGETYKSDYDNWCDLLSKKAQAYNRFVDALRSASNTNTSGSPLSAKGQAEKIIKDTKNGTENVYDPMAKKGAGYFATQAKPGAYTKGQVDAAREFLKANEQTEKLKEELKFDLANIGTDFGGNYSPKSSVGSSGSGNSSDKNKKEETKKEFDETYDWIERLIKRLQRAFDKWVGQAETALTSGFIAKYYKKAASAAKKQLSAYGKAYNKYMSKANAVGLDEKYAKKIRNGTIDIEAIRAEGTEAEIQKYEELADKIKEYQEWYDKAQDSMESFMETAEKLYSLPLEKAAKKIEKFSDAIDLLSKRLDNAIGSKDKNKLIDRQTAEEKKTLNAYKKAGTESKKSLRSAKKELKKNRYLNADDGISKKERKNIKKAVKKNKEVNLSFFKENSAGYRAAVKYNEALKANKKAVYDAQGAQQEYNSWLVEASKLKFDNIADDYNKKIQKLGWEMSALDNKVSEAETAGKNVDKAYYKSQKGINARMLARYKAEKKALEENVKNIKEGTEEWYDAKDQIQEVNNAISDCVKETYELNNAINQLYFDLFDGISEGIHRIITEQEFLQGLFAHEKNADAETGNFTEAGIAKLGSLSASYYASKNNSDRDSAMLKELQNVKDFGKQKDGSYKLGEWEFNSLDDLQAKIDEVYTKWQDDIKETYSLESSIVDVMKEKYQAELDLLQELIDRKKEALNAEKDLHDYQKSIDGKTKDTTTIQKQIAAYSGDTSQEGLAKLQKLQKELSDKEEDLRETEYDRYISDQQDMLDRLYEEYNELMQKKMDDFMTLVREGLQTSNNNTFAISSYLNKIAKENGYIRENDGTAEVLGAGISGNVDQTISNIATEKGERSGTNPPKDNSGGLFQKKEGTNTQGKKQNFSVKEKAYKTDYKETAENYIRKHASKASKKRSEYSDINKAVYDNKGKLYKGKGKVLSSKELTALAKQLMVEYDGDKSKKGALYKRLKSLKVPGFRKGGIVSVDDIEKQVKANGDDGIVSVKNGEGILTEKQTESIQKLSDSLEDGTPKKDGVIRMKDGTEFVPLSQEEMLKGLIARSNPGIDVSNIDVSNIMKNIAPPDFGSMIKPNIPNVQSVTNNNNKVVNIENITLPNVKNYDEFRDRMFKDAQRSGNFSGFVGDKGVNQIINGEKVPRFRKRL